MRLDRTLIAVRERGTLEVLDLALVVARSYARPLLCTFALGALPLAALNWLLIGWMARVEYGVQFPHRFVWNMLMLITVEAPLASVFATGYLGEAVFQQRPSVRRVVANVTKLLPRIAWCQLLPRLVVPVWLAYLLVERGGDLDPMVEVLAVPAMVLCSLLVRGLRPFINEVVILERNPLRAARRDALTIARRSASLHGPSSGDMLLRLINGVVVALSLFVAIYGACLFISGAFFGQWRQGWLMVTCLLPLSMWLVAAYFAVVRFLAYLDLRIRQEGWEVELKLRAEAAKMAGWMS